MPNTVPAAKDRQRTLTEDEIAAALDGLRRAAELRERMLARRGGQPLPSSWRIIRRQRERRPAV